jgi:hypothetical protein
MRVARRAVLIPLLAALFSATTWAPPAGAAFHLIKVKEVFPGNSSSPNAHFIELQMYAAGQTQVGGHPVTVYDSTGALVGTFTFGSSVPNGADQATILVATTEAQTYYGVTADLIMTPVIAPSGGAVCFDNIDCVSWGTFSGSTPSPSGTPWAGPIPSSLSIQRKISGGTNPNALDAGDDTDDSNTDFDHAPPTPEANPLPGGGGGGGGGGPGHTVQDLKTKVRGGMAIISGRLDPPDPLDHVKVSLLAKGSPFKKVGFKGDGLDAQSRFKVRIDVPDDVQRCKTLVKYRGDIIGTKRFGC